MRKNIPPQIYHYLSKRADKKWLNYNVQQKYKTVVVIPVIKEFDNIPQLLNSLKKNDEGALRNSLLLFVINNSDKSSVEVIEDNEKSFDLLRKYKQEPTNLNIEYIDAFSTGNELPSKTAGVGLARKVGMDQALLYFDYSSNGNAIVCLDADCEVSPNYLTEIQKHFNNNFKTAVVKYEHRLDNDAIINYEIFLRYYVLGLMFSGSPYAYHSIGSCMVVEPFTYVKIGGMNKKKAGEDFYFLEKAAKVTEVKSMNGTTVFPSSRKSWRVPFGTGQRVTRFYEKVKNEYVLYNPSSFVVLKEFLKIYFDENNMPENILSESKTISISLYNFMVENDFLNSLTRIYENAKTREQLYHQKKIWFDAFKTLKLIHYLRDNGFPEKQMFNTLNEMVDLVNETGFTKYTSDDLPPIEKQVEYLTLLRRLT